MSNGAIIESGNNANGYYVKFADGTMVCWGRSSMQFTTGQYTEIEKTLPAAVAPNFSQVYGAMQNLSAPGTSSVCIGCDCVSESAVKYKFDPLVIGTGGTYTGELGWFVITRWKA